MADHKHIYEGDPLDFPGGLQGDVQYNGGMGGLSGDIGLWYDPSTKRVSAGGIRSSGRTLQVYGGDLEFKSVTVAHSLSGTAIAGGSLASGYDGDFDYYVTFVRNGLETSPVDSVLNVPTSGTDQTVRLTGIPVDPTGIATARRLYRNVNSGDVDNGLFVEITDNTTTTFDDDGSLNIDTPYPQYDLASGNIWFNGTRVFRTDGLGTVIGYGAYPTPSPNDYGSHVEGSSAAPLMTGSTFSTILGFGAAPNLVNSYYNTLVGASIAPSLEFGSFNTFLGTQSGNGTVNGSYNTHLGVGTGQGDYYYTVALGAYAQPSADYVAMIGSDVTVGYAVKLGLGTNAPSAQFHQKSRGAAEISQIVQGYSGQTADLVRWTASSSTNALSGVDASGRLFVGRTSASALLHVGASTTTQAAFHIDSGSVPSTFLSNGDLWHTSNHLYARLGGTTYQLDQQASPGGSGSQVQYRLSGTAFGGISGSSVSSGFLTLTSGFNSQGSGSQSVQIGGSSASVRSNSVAIGQSAATAAGADVVHDGAVSIGYQTSTEDGAVAIGAYSHSKGVGVAIGYNASSDAGGFSIGTGAISSGVGAAIGTSVTTVNGVSIGNNSVTLDYGTAIGKSASATGKGIGLGTYSAASDHQFVAGSGNSSLGSGASVISEVYFGSGPADPSPSDYTLYGSGGFGTNVAGANLIVSGGRGTGTGAGGDVIVKAAVAGSSGTTLNAASETARFLATGGLKLASKTLLGTPQAGHLEYNGTHFYGTVGSTRYQLDQQTVTLTGDVTGSGTGSFATTLATVNSTPGTFGGSSAIPIITVNGKGLITNVTTALLPVYISSLSGNTTNGFTVTPSGSVSSPTLVISTSVNGLVKANGTGISAAVAGTDYLAPFAAVTVTSSYTATASNKLIFADATSGNLTVTMPTTGLYVGQEFSVKKTDATAGVVTFGGTLDGVSNPTISTQYGTYNVAWNGTNYYKLSQI